MLIRTALFCCTLLAFAAPGPAPLAADLPAYHLSMAVDYEKGTFEATANVHYENHTGAALDEVYFRLWPNAHDVFGTASLDVTSAQVNGQATASELGLDPTVLRVPLSLAPDGAADITLAFRGRASRFSSNARWTDEGLLAKPGWTDTMTLVAFYPILAPYGRGGWILDPLTDRAGIGVAETAAYQLEIVLSPGVTMIPAPDAAAVQPDGRICYSLSRRSVRDLSLVLAGGKWVPLQAESDGITLRCWSASGESAVAVRTLELAAAAVHIYTSLFGPLPWTTIDIAHIQMRYRGIGLSGLILLRTGYNKVPIDPGFETLLLHEMAHEWFGNAVGNDYLREPWLGETLAEYASYVASGTAISASAAEKQRTAWRTFFDSYAQPSSRPELRVTDAAGTYPDLVSFLAFVYNGGPLVLDDLRRAIGDEAFFAALADYYRSQAGHIATAADLIGSFARAGDGGRAGLLFGGSSPDAP